MFVFTHTQRTLFPVQSAECRVQSAQWKLLAFNALLMLILWLHTWQMEHWNGIVGDKCYAFCMFESFSFIITNKLQK